MNIHILSDYMARISNLNPLILKKFLFSGLFVTLLSYLSFPLIFYYFNEAYFNLAYLISAIIYIFLSFFYRSFMFLNQIIRFLKNILDFYLTQYV